MEKSEPEIEKNGKLRPEGRPLAILGNGRKTTPKSIHKSVEINQKTIHSLKELKQIN